MGHVLLVTNHAVFVKSMDPLLGVPHELQTEKYACMR